MPQNQRDFLKELRLHARKLILVLTGGSAIAIPEEHELCDAVIQAWYPGCEGGRALADVLFGDVSPSGKMPVTVPMRTADLPAFNDYRMQGRTYKFAKVEPLYPFGFGLSYAHFTFEALSPSSSTLSKGQEITVRTRIHNASEHAADETVQCYIKPPRSFPDAPIAMLVDFKKLNVPAKGSAEVEFKLSDEVFKLTDARGERVRVPGVFEIVVGSCSPSPRAQVLGAPAPARASVTVV
jgi:beta-glucosidase